MLGPILVPLLAAGGLGPISAGAILLLGSSMGGELFNPGAVEMRKLAELTGMPSGRRRRPVGAVQSPGVRHGGSAAFWLLSARRRENHRGSPSYTTRARTAGRELEPCRINLIKAMVPVVPILLLSLDAAFGPFGMARSRSRGRPGFWRRC